jgi:hypothetical protein
MPADGGKYPQLFTGGNRYVNAIKRKFDTMSQGGFPKTYSNDGVKTNMPRLKNG